jgi:hypothetical protein
VRDRDAWEAFFEMLGGLEQKRLLREFMLEAVSGDPIPLLIRARIGKAPEINVEILPDVSYPDDPSRIVFRRGLGSHGEEWDSGTLRQPELPDLALVGVPMFGVPYGGVGFIETDLGARELRMAL